LGVLADIGNLEWARRTNGILGRGERARFVAAVALEQGRVLPRVLGARIGILGGPGGPDPSKLAPPDSAVAREVIETVTELDTSVVEHSYRCYLYARALALAEGVECDEEAVFVAAMLHDHGTKEIPTLTDRCFTLVGADEALATGERAGWEVARREAAAEAITLHLNPAVPVDQGLVQHLLHDGVLLDVFGIRASELSSEGIDRVRERHPRLGFNRVGGGLLRENGRRVPGCRSATLFATGFGLALKLSPWQD
jgi:hypothetical protein